MTEQPKSYFGEAVPINDDVLIELPEEFGIEAGEEFVATRRADGVVILRPTATKSK
jgi:hypothetical protein